MRAFAYVAAVVVAVVALGAGVGALANRSVAQPALCRSVSRLDRLVVHRSDAFPENHIRFSFPAEVTVTDVGNVRSVARALCSLPHAPSGPTSCPADLGIAYHLFFSAGDRTFGPVEVEATGCRVVRGLGPVRWGLSSTDLWPSLARAVGLSSSTPLFGSLPSGS